MRRQSERAGLPLTEDARGVLADQRRVACHDAELTGR
jgi:hypothetical protein